ncbi:transmembrane emp24 domain-containing protein 6 [Aulostomus maculatus]
MFHCIILFLGFWGPVGAGPLTDPHPNITDQQLFWGADQYDFSVVLHAAGLECFWHFAHRGESFYLSFMVQWVTGVGHDRHLSVTVNAPSSLLVSTVDDANGQINFEAEETGFYQMCFSNFHNHFGTMQVSLSFGVYYDGHQDAATNKEEEKTKREEARKDLNNTLSIIEEATHKVETYVFHMFRYYSYSRMRKSADYFLLLSNSKYVSWWSAALSLLVVTSGYLQLLFLKRLFISREPAEPRPPSGSPPGAAMLVNVLLLVLSSGFIWCRKSEPSLPDADAGLFRGSDKYDFALEIPAAATECLWHFAHQSGRFYLTFLGSLQKLQNQVFHMWRHYNFARMTKGRDHYLLLSNLSYVDCWSASQTFVILVSGYLQLLVLKRLFNTDASRPRC